MEYLNFFLCFFVGWKNEIDLGEQIQDFKNSYFIFVNYVCKVVGYMNIGICGDIGFFGGIVQRWW